MLARQRSSPQHLTQVASTPGLFCFIGSFVPVNQRISLGVVLYSQDIIVKKKHTPLLGSAYTLTPLPSKCWLLFTLEWRSFTACCQGTHIKAICSSGWVGLCSHCKPTAPNQMELSQRHLFQAIFCSHLFHQMAHMPNCTLVSGQRLQSIQVWKHLSSLLAGYEVGL